MHALNFFLKHTFRFTKKKKKKKELSEKWQQHEWFLKICHNDRFSCCYQLSHAIIADSVGYLKIIYLTIEWISYPQIKRKKIEKEKGKGFGDVETYRMIIAMCK